MGWNLRCIAFDEQPNIAKLDALDWLEAYRLFRHKQRAEWYLEGPCPGSDDITLVYPMLPHRPNLDAFERSNRTVAALVVEFRSRGWEAESLDAQGLLQALALTEALGQAILYVSSDDESLDSGFICNHGSLTSARIVVSKAWTLSLHGDQSAVSAEGNDAPFLWRCANLVAADFFARPKETLTFDDDDFNSSEYRLVAAKGAAPPLPPKPEAEQRLQEISGEAAGDMKTLLRALAIMEPYVCAASDERLISADRKALADADANLGACLLFAHQRNHYRGRYEDLTAYLSEVSQYLRMLRPKPEFRREIDFAKMCSELRAAWNDLKTKLATTQDPGESR